jgi:3-hydroxybutyryl-CoA dehydrogenase
VPAGDASSIPIARLTPAPGRQEAAIGLHFFNPVPVMPLVEVAPLLHAPPPSPRPDPHHPRSACG